MESWRIPCSCGEYLTPERAHSCYHGTGVACNDCLQLVISTTLVFHCRQEKNAFHPDGYDLCQSCSRRKKQPPPVLCKCSRTMEKSTPARAYGNLASCDGCGDNIHLNEQMYHCTSSHHFAGWDYCLSCAQQPKHRRVQTPRRQQPPSSQISTFGSIVDPDFQVAVFGSIGSSTHVQTTQQSNICPHCNKKLTLQSSRSCYPNPLTIIICLECNSMIPPLEKFFHCSAHSYDICKKCASPSLSVDDSKTPPPPRHPIFRRPPQKPRTRITRTTHTRSPPTRRPRRRFSQEVNGLLSQLRLDETRLGVRPTFWSSRSGIVQLADGEYPCDLVLSAFYQTVSHANYDILSIELIQYEHLMQDYKDRRESRKRFLGEDGLNEKFLFHGTKEEVIESICERGFKRDYGETMMYGNGVYFARDASYSCDNAYSKPNRRGVKHMFWCLVMCGESCVGRKDMMRPPMRRGTGRPQEYDSLVDDLRNPAIIVAPHDYMAVPIVLIKFRRK